MIDGTFIEHDGRPAVQFRRSYDHPVERVWQALTNPAELVSWFPSEVALEPRVGGAIEFSGDPNMPSFSGTVLAYEPPTRLAYSWGTDELHFELQPAGAGGCVLTLVNVLSATGAAARQAAGWQVCLAELDQALAGRTAGGPHSEAATPWRPIYDSYVAAGMPSGAPIPGQG